MASAYVIEVITRCRPREARLWLPTDPIPDDLAPPEANQGIFEALYDPQGRVAGPGTWVAVTDLPAGYTDVAIDRGRSAGISALVRELDPATKKAPGRCFGIALQPGFAGTHRLAVVFTGGKLPPLRMERTFEVMRVTVPPHLHEGHCCSGELEAELLGVPKAVMAALAAGKHAPLALHREASRGVASIGAFEATGPASGKLAIVIEDVPGDERVLAVTARCPEDGRTITASSAPFWYPLRPRVEVRGPAAARSLPADPPALYRIGPFDGMRDGDADLVHAAFADLRALGHAYKSNPWSFQLRAQPLRAANGGLNRAVPRVVAGQLERTAGGDLGVVIAADATHPRQSYALVDHGKVSARRPILPTGNAFLPADGTFPELAIALRGAGIDRTVSLPDHAVLFFLDEHELTNPRDGLLRGLDVATDHAGTPVIVAVHVLAPCGCVSRLELGNAVAETPAMALANQIGIQRAQR